MIVRAALLAVVLTLSAQAAWADDGVDVKPGGNTLVVQGTQAGAKGTLVHGSAHEGVSNPSPAPVAAGPSTNSAPQCAIGGAQTCGELATCPDGSFQKHFWQEDSNGQYIPGSDSYGCGSAPPAPTASTPSIDPKSALETVPLPDSVLHVQPVGNQTLVHFKTNFYTDAAPFPAQVPLFDGTVTVDFKIRPVEFDWTFGDGTTLTTTSPGAPYPKLDVTHEYAKTGTVTASVTTVWGADYRVNGGAWGPVNGTVTKTGGGVAITIRQATPVLTD